MLAEYQPGAEEWMTTKNPPFCAYSLRFLKDQNPTAWESASLSLWPATSQWPSREDPAAWQSAPGSTQPCLPVCLAVITAFSAFCLEWASLKRTHARWLRGYHSSAAEWYIVGVVIIRTSCQLLPTWLRGKKDVFLNKASPAHAAPVGNWLVKESWKAPRRPSWRSESSPEELKPTCLSVNMTLHGRHGAWAASAVFMLPSRACVQWETGVTAAFYLFVFLLFPQLS